MNATPSQIIGEVPAWTEWTAGDAQTNVLLAAISLVAMTLAAVTMIIVGPAWTACAPLLLAGLSLVTFAERRHQLRAFAARSSAI